MPHEQEMPAPVTMTMRLLLVTESERLSSVQQATGSDDVAARLDVVIEAELRGGRKEGRRRRGDWAIARNGLGEMVKVEARVGRCNTHQPRTQILWDAP
jgi:hypothetical protein